MQLMQLTLDFRLHLALQTSLHPATSTINGLSWNYCSPQKKVCKRVTRWCAKCGLHVIEKIKAPRLHSAAAVNAQPPTPQTHPLPPSTPSPLLQTAFL